MDALAFLIMAATGWAFAVFMVVTTRKDVADARATHAQELATRDARIESLLSQVQLNAQHIPYYPTLGPAPEPVPEQRYYGDPMDTGLLVVSEDELLEAAVQEITGGLD